MSGFNQLRISPLGFTQLEFSEPVSILSFVKKSIFKNKYKTRERDEIDEEVLELSKTVRCCIHNTSFLYNLQTGPLS